MEVLTHLRPWLVSYPRWDFGTESYLLARWPAWLAVAEYKREVWLRGLRMKLKFMVEQLKTQESLVLNIAGALNDGANRK